MFKFECHCSNSGEFMYLIQLSKTQNCGHENDCKCDPPLFPFYIPAPDSCSWFLNCDMLKSPCFGVLVVVMEMMIIMECYPFFFL